jgi:hypothetical protein
MLSLHNFGGNPSMKKVLFLLLSVCAAGLLTGVAAAQTQIVAPSAGITDTTLLPLNVSGLSVCPGVEFEIRYDFHVITINGITSAPQYRGTISILPNINNAMGSARVLVISTNGITAGAPAPLLMINVSVNGTGYTPLQVQNAKWVSADFNSVAFDTATSGLITTNGATVPPASVITTLPPVTIAASPVLGTPTTLPTLDLPTPAETTTPAEQVSFGVPVTTTVPLPERTMVLFSPAPTETGAGVPTPTETTTPLPGLTAQPTSTQKSPGFSFVIAFTASGLAALAYLGFRKV